MSEVESLNGHALAADLIDHNVGYVTRFGVVYPNEMELSQIYKGRSFPTYCYEASLLEIEMVPKFEPEDTANITNFLLPMHPEQIERTMLRAGITNSDDMQLRFQGSLLPDAIDVALDMEHEGIADLNDMCIAIEPLSREDIAKLGVVVSFAKPEYASEIKHLAENLELFDYAPGIRTPEDYGKYMIQESGHFEYDENLDEYYDYARYGQERMDNEQGFFGDSGYVAYHGELGLDELMADDPCTQALGGMEMG